MSLPNPVLPTLQTQRAAVKETLGQRLRRQVSFYGMIFFIIVIWAGSSLFIAPIVQFGLDRFGEFIETHQASRQESTLVGVRLSVPCEAFEDVPAGCDGLEPGELAYGPGSVLFFFGRMPNLDGISNNDRQIGILPSADSDGVFYTLQKAFGRIPLNDDALALARQEMGSYGAYTEYSAGPGVTVVAAAEGSTSRGNFYAVYARADGSRVAAACFGGTCKLAQAPWKEGLAYGITIAARNVARLPEIDTAVQTRIEGFLVK